MKNVNQKPTPESNIQILKTESCPSVSGASTLTYQVGCNEAGEFLLRLTANTAAGFFSNEWVSLDAIENALNTNPKFTSQALKSLFIGKSQNTPGFLLAVLLHEGLVIKADGSQRCYLKQDFESFKSELQKLTASKEEKTSKSKPKTA